MNEELEQRVKSYSDAIKLMKGGTDIVKHLATLSTGAIVLAATFLEKFQSAHRAHWAPAFAIGLISVSLIASVSSLLHIMKATSSLNTLRDSVRAGTTARPHHLEKMAHSIQAFNRSLRICAWTFISGILTLAAFSIANSI